MTTNVCAGVAEVAAGFAAAVEAAGVAAAGVAAAGSRANLAGSKTSFPSFVLAMQRIHVWGGQAVAGSV